VTALSLLLLLAQAAPAPSPAPKAGQAQARPAVSQGSVQSLLERGRRALGGGDAAAALVPLRHALELAPNSEEVLETYAQACLGARQTAPAVQALEDLARMNPKVAAHRYQLGVALLQAGDPARAAEALAEAERLDPRHTPTLVARGRAENALKRYDQARAVLERALAREPENAEALAALAEARNGGAPR
jgi:tetratricopeptide (TPR) repeat protein